MAAFVTIGPLLTVSARIVSGMLDGFELIDWIIIVAGLTISVTALVLYLLDRRRRNR
jgi:Kef-type K+ transport system membrane component KefB